VNFLKNDERSPESNTVRGKTSKLTIILENFGFKAENIEITLNS